MNNKTYIPTKVLVRCGLLVAVTAILAQIYIPLPFTPIPITLQTFSVLLMSGLLEPAMAGITIFTYILLGAVGVPVFSGFKGGFSALSGPTAGFIIGFIPAVIIASTLFKKGRHTIISVVVFHVVLYFFGCTWLKLQTGTTFLSAFMMAVAPYILGDISKSILFMVVQPKLKRVLGYQ